MRKMMLALAIALFPLSTHADGGASILKLVEQGRFDEARAELAKEKHTDLDALLLEARIRMVAKKATEAVTILRAILAAQPQLIGVRQLLAEALMDAEDWDAASYHLKALQAADPRPGAQAAYANGLKTIAARKPFGVYGSIAITPSDNATDASNSEDYRSGVKSKSNIGLFVRRHVGTHRFQLNLETDITLNSVDRFKRASPRASLSWQNRRGRNYEQARLTFERVFDHDSVNKSKTAQATVGFGRMLDTRHDIFGSASLRRTTYDNAPASNGHGLSGEIGLSRQISPSFYIYGAVGYNRYSAEAVYSSYKMPSLRVGGGMSWKGGWNATLALSGSYKEYDGPMRFMGLGTSTIRKDRTVAIQASIVNSNFSWAGFAPRLNCSWQKVESTIDRNDSLSRECGLLLTREF